MFLLFLGKDPVVLKSLGYWEYLYEAAVIVWIIFGLGYVIMIINIIADGLKAPARKIKTFATKTEKAIMSKIFEEIVIIKSKVRYCNPTNSGHWKFTFGNCIFREISFSPGYVFKNFSNFRSYRNS